MPRAVGPILVAAILLLVGGAIVAGVRLGGDAESTAQPDDPAPGGVEVTATETPFAFDSPTDDVSPTPTETTPSDGPTGPLESPTGATDDGAAGDGEVGADGQSGDPSDGDTGAAGGADDGDDEGGDAGDHADAGGAGEPSDDRSPSDDETVLAIDDMPDTGGGAALVGTAFVMIAVASALRLGRRR